MGLRTSSFEWLRSVSQIDKASFAALETRAASSPEAKLTHLPYLQRGTCTFKRARGKNVQEIPWKYHQDCYRTLKTRARKSFSKSDNKRCHVKCQANLNHMQLLPAVKLICHRI